MEPKKVVDYLFPVIISALGTVAVAYQKNISDNIEKISQNVISLNLRSELLQDRTGRLEDGYKDHEFRIRKIEIKEKR